VGSGNAVRGIDKLILVKSIDKYTSTSCIHASRWGPLVGWGLGHLHRSPCPRAGPGDGRWGCGLGTASEQDPVGAGPAADGDRQRRCTGTGVGGACVGVARDA